MRLGREDVSVSRSTTSSHKGDPTSRNLRVAILAGAAIGILSGLIGPGGAEFRLPLLICLFGFAALQAIILKKAMSLVVVLTTGLVAALMGVAGGELLIPTIVLLYGSTFRWPGASHCLAPYPPC